MARIDGQVPVTSTASLVRKSRILILTPDIIQAWLMSSVADPALRAFLKRPGLVIVDEVHSYFESLLGQPSPDDETAEEFSALLRKWRRDSAGALDPNEPRDS